MPSHQELIARGWLTLHSEPGAAENVDVPENTLNCGCPDQPSQSVASAQISDIAAVLECSTEEASQLRDSHRAMLSFRLAAATGSGSWAKGCYPPFPNHHAWRVFYDTSDLPSHMTRDVTDREFDEVIVRAKVWDASNIAEAKAKWATEDYFPIPANWNVPATSVFSVMVRLSCEASRRVGIATILADDGPDGKHNQHVFYQVIPGSTIGLGYFPPANSCNAHVKKIIDRGWDQGLNQQCKLDLHETGHTLGLYHEFTSQERHHSIMSYSWLISEPFVGWRKKGNEWVNEVDASISELIEFFGGEEVPLIDQPPPPPPPPPPPSEAPRIEDINIQHGGRTWTYRVVPKNGGTPPFPPIGV